MLGIKDVNIIYSILTMVNILLILLCLRQIRMNLKQRDWTSALVFILNMIGLLIVSYVFAEAGNLF